MVDMWAHAYLPGALHTNGHIESYHGVIKSLFLVTKFALPFPHQVCKRATLTRPFDLPSGGAGPAGPPAAILPLHTVAGSEGGRGRGGAPDCLLPHHL